MAVGGDITEVTDNHPTLGSFVYKIVANQDNTYDIGGARENDDVNMVTSGREMISQINTKLGFVQFMAVNDMTNKVIERLSNLAGSTVPSVWTFTSINGITYRGTGKPVGDLSANVNNSQIQVKINAPEFKQL